MKILGDGRSSRIGRNDAYTNVGDTILDCDDGIEYSACQHEPSPQELLERKELFYHLWNALNSLPEVQGVRVEAHLILGKSYTRIAKEQGADRSAVRRSVKRGKTAMKKYLKKVL